MHYFTSKSCFICSSDQVRSNSRRCVGVPGWLPADMGEGLLRSAFVFWSLKIIYFLYLLNTKKQLGVKRCLLKDFNLPQLLYRRSCFFTHEGFIKKINTLHVPRIFIKLWQQRDFTNKQNKILTVTAAGMWVAWEQQCNK